MKATKWKKIKSEDEYKGKRIHIRLDHFKLPDGKETQYSVLDRGEIVAILALTPKREVLLVKQFRPAVDEITLDLPGGCVETWNKEDPIDAALRELEEETGYYAKKIERIGSFFYPDSGRSDQKRHLFIASSLIKSKQKLDSGEIVEVHKVPIMDVIEGIKSGKYKETTLCLGCLFWYMENFSLHKDSKSLKQV